MADDRTAPPPDEMELVRLDPWLKPYAQKLRARYERYVTLRRRIEDAAGSLADFARGHEYLGFNRGEQDGRPGLWYREWAPQAHALFLIGDFNHWHRGRHQLRRTDGGVWQIFLPDDQPDDRIPHGTAVKTHVISELGPMDRIPAYIRRVAPEPGGQHFVGQYWAPSEPYTWRHEPPAPPISPRIYEAHVGMAVEAQRVGTYREFADQVLPRIARAGYNTVQLMAILEHPYYGSFGYQVSNFFAPSSRFGTPEELKALIDTAHGLGLRVLLDIVHSHVVKNVQEGLNRFDGTDYQYFHAGPRGQHPAWDSLLFDYAKWDVLRFLLSNVRYWLEEFRFDGFRFDGVTSMMYLDHGLGRPFTGYDDYFPPHVDEDAIAYLQIANDLVHTLRPDACTVAEDVSGMVGTARPVAEGGLGFDYRLAMGIPDYWIRILKERRDEEWSLAEIYHTLTNRRRGEKHVAYAESHDQSLVGDKTIAFWLMDAAMYHHMTKDAQHAVIDRGVALHKILRLLTFVLGGEGYLNFMGNEFGHPEWVDFPRAGNNNSYQFARRQWSLVDDPLLRYHDLAEFDRAMLAIDERYHILAESDVELLLSHEDQKVMICRRGPFLLAANLHPTASYADYRVGVPAPADYRLVLNTDDLFFGGHAIVRTGQVYPWQSVPCHAQPQSVQVYLPARTAQLWSPK